MHVSHTDCHTLCNYIYSATLLVAGSMIGILAVAVLALALALCARWVSDIRRGNAICIHYITSMLTYSMHIFMPPVHKYNYNNIYVHLHKNACIHYFIHTFNNFSHFVFLPQL